MKKEKALRVMGLIDEAYIEEADPGKAKARRKLERRAVITTCVCGLAAAAAVLWLFVPFRILQPSVTRYRNSEYYEIIQKLREYNDSTAAAKNNYQKYMVPILKSFIQNAEQSADTALYEAPVSSMPGDGLNYDSQTYEEITDNQVDDVIEADRIKRSDKYIYYLCDDVLRVYSIEGEASKEVGSYIIANERMAYRYTEEWEFYLSKDCRTVTVVVSFANEQKEACVGLLALDVTDPANITEKGMTSITGVYLSSRYTDGEVLLMSQFRVGSKPDYSDESTYLPQVDTGNGVESIPGRNIIAPEELTSSRYTVVCKLDAESLEVKDCAAFLSYSENFYVSEENIFATRDYEDKYSDDTVYGNREMTEIYGLSYGGDTMEQLGSVTVEGYVNDQYSLDEYKGVLRVVTTTEAVEYKREIVDGEIVGAVYNKDVSGTSANLYCIDLSTWQVTAQVTGFAPKGERVQSVRFDGTDCYVCTAVVITLTDPVFFFDLSDLSNITYKDTGTIQGYSSSLVNLGDGFLLGIGEGSSRGSLKVEVYEESGSDVVSVCKYELLQTGFSEDYKAYYVDRANRLIGLGVDTQTNQGQYAVMSEQYLLLFFDGYELRELLNVPLPGSVDIKRAVYIDGYFYMFGEDAFVVEKIGGGGNIDR